MKQTSLMRSKISLKRALRSGNELRVCDTRKGAEHENEKS